MLARQITLLDPLPAKLTPLLRYSCGLFVAPQKVKPFRIKQLQTLSAKHRGWGYPDLQTFRRSDLETLFCPPFVFITLQIAFPASRLFSQPSALLGGGGLSPSLRVTVPLWPSIFIRVCFHRVTNPSARKPFVCTSIQNARGVVSAGLLEDAGGCGIRRPSWRDPGSGGLFAGLVHSVPRWRSFPKAKRPGGLLRGVTDYDASN
jgi:hypothetical protein